MSRSNNSIEAGIRRHAFSTIEQVYSDLSANEKGLSPEEVQIRLEVFGENIIKIDNKGTTLYRLKEAIVNPFNIILLVIAFVTFFTDVVIPKEPDYTTVVIILSLVTLASLVAFIQTERSNTAAEKLSKLISNKADAWRAVN